MKSIFYISLFSLIIGLLACKKGKCNDYQMYNIDKELKDYMLHPVGSYWVYQDSASNYLDTVFITHRFEEIRDINEACEGFEIIDDRLYSSKKQESFIKKGFDLNGLYFNDPIHIYRGIKSEQVFVSDTKIEYIDNTLKVKYLGQYEELKFNGVDYVDVKKFENTYPNQSRDILYIAKGIGFIRKEYSNGEVWDLIDYKVD